MNAQLNDLARKWFESVWNQRSTETIHRLVHPNCLGHHEGSETCGPAALQAMRDRLLTMLPDLQVVIEDVVADGDDAVVRWRFRGTPANQRPVSFSGMTWMKFRDGQIVEGWDSWNQAALIQHLQLPA